MAGYAESAYQHVSSELKHDLSMKLPLILFSTASEFWQQNVVPGAAQEGVGAFAEPGRYRMVMPIDEPPDLLYRLIVHELTHQFHFLARTGMGIYEIITFPIPPYDPIGKNYVKPGRVYPDNYQPRLLDDSLYATDTALAEREATIATQKATIATRDAEMADLAGELHNLHLEVKVTAFKARDA